LDEEELYDSWDVTRWEDSSGGLMEAERWDGRMAKVRRPHRRSSGLGRFCTGVPELPQASRTRAAVSPWGRQSHTISRKAVMLGSIRQGGLVK
jgi:hypothetical protein